MGLCFLQIKLTVLKWQSWQVKSEGGLPCAWPCGHAGRAAVPVPGHVDMVVLLLWAVALRQSPVTQVPFSMCHWWF